jgi:hypothetical protein
MGEPGLSEIIHSQKDKYCMISPTRGIQNSQTHKIRVQPGVRAWGNDLQINGITFRFYNMGKV